MQDAACRILLLKSRQSQTDQSSKSNGFLNRATPKSSSIYRWIFPSKPTSYWGTPMAMSDEHSLVTQLHLASQERLGIMTCG